MTACIGLEYDLAILRVHQARFSHHRPIRILGLDNCYMVVLHDNYIYLVFIKIGTNFDCF